MAEMSHLEAQAEGLSPSVAKAMEGKPSEQERPVYEVGFHVAPSVPEAGVIGVVENIRAALGPSTSLGTSGAEIISEQLPQKMTLAYTIVRSHGGKREKSNEAYFGCIKFALEREALPALEGALRAMREVLRFLIIETVREEITVAPRRAVFSSDRLEGETLKKPLSDTVEEKAPVSEEELDKSIEALVH